MGNRAIDKARKALGGGYVYGTIYPTIPTDELIAELVETYGRGRYYFSDGTTAKKWKGVPSGDCSGFVKGIWRACGFKVDDVNAAGLFAKYCTEIRKDQLKPGDLVFIKPAGKEINHVAFYQGSGKTIEAKSTKAGIVEDSADRFNRYGRPIFNADYADPKPVPPKPFRERLINAAKTAGFLSDEPLWLSYISGTKEPTANNIRWLFKKITGLTNAEDAVLVEGMCKKKGPKGEYLVHMPSLWVEILAGKRKAKGADLQTILIRATGVEI